MKPKTTISLLLVTLFASTGISQNQILLNGPWRFLASSEGDETQILSATDYAKWDTLTVPGNWDT